MVRIRRVKHLYPALSGYCGFEGFPVGRIEILSLLAFSLFAFLIGLAHGWRELNWGAEKENCASGFCASPSFLTYGLRAQNLRSGDIFWPEGLKDRDRQASPSSSDFLSILGIF